MKKILAPLRGVTIRTFRKVFAEEIREAGFEQIVAPFIPANVGMKFTRRIFGDIAGGDSGNRIELVPQVIGKDAGALREWCKAVKGMGYAKADLNAGCPFPMIRKKGRGAGLLKSPETLKRMLETGCDEMGNGNFSLKTRLGMERMDELAGLMDAINQFPLGMLTVHARTAAQMYEGEVHAAAFAEVAKQAKVPVVYNGDAGMDGEAKGVDAGKVAGVMIGRSFIRDLGRRENAGERLREYIKASREELCGDAPVLGRMKELLAYWCANENWKRKWQIIKICRSIDELLMVI